MVNSFITSILFVLNSMQFHWFAITYLVQRTIQLKIRRISDFENSLLLKRNLRPFTDLVRRTNRTQVDYLTTDNWRCRRIKYELFQASMAIDGIIMLPIRYGIYSNFGFNIISFCHFVFACNKADSMQTKPIHILNIRS